MDLQLNDKTVLVTGAGQGLGRAIGLAFSREGARVAFHYNSSAEGADKAAAEVNAAGGAALAVQADLRDDAAVEGGWPNGTGDPSSACSVTPAGWASPASWSPPPPGPRPWA